MKRALLLAARRVRQRARSAPRDRRRAARARDHRRAGRGQARRDGRRTPRSSPAPTARSPIRRRWAYCTAPKPPTEDNAVSRRLPRRRDARRRSARPRPSRRTLPTDGCMLFGPDVAARRLPPARSGSDRRLLPAGARRRRRRCVALRAVAHHVQPRDARRRRRARLPDDVRRERESDARSDYAARDRRRATPTSRSPPRGPPRPPRATSTSIPTRRCSSPAARRCACRGSRPAARSPSTRARSARTIRRRPCRRRGTRPAPGPAWRVARAARQPRRHRDAAARGHRSVSCNNTRPWPR